MLVQNLQPFKNASFVMMDFLSTTNKTYDHTPILMPVQTENQIMRFAIFSYNLAKSYTLQITVF